VEEREGGKGILTSRKKAPSSLRVMVYEEKRRGKKRKRFLNLFSFKFTTGISGYSSEEGGGEADGLPEKRWPLGGGGGGGGKKKGRGNACPPPQFFDTSKEGGTRPVNKIIGEVTVKEKGEDEIPANLCSKKKRKRHPLGVKSH